MRLAAHRSSRSRSSARAGGGVLSGYRWESSTEPIGTSVSGEPLLLRRRGVEPTSVSALWIGAASKSVTTKSLSKRFALACRQAGIRARAFRGLRHTYAILMLATLTRRLRHEGDGHVNAVKTLQLLGLGLSLDSHRSIAAVASQGRLRRRCAVLAARLG
jgi:integrase